MLSKLFYLYKQYKTLSKPVKRWVISHPFVANKALKCTRIAQAAAATMAKSNELDGDAAGGQVDAYRHGYWMALLTKHIGAKRALKLGRAYEKGNKQDFIKHRNEDGALPDRISSEMDLKNNELGTRIALQYPKATDEGLQQAVKAAVKSGQLWIIKKNKQGIPLMLNNQPLDLKKYNHKWYVPKSLVPSNQQRPN